jgi:prolyl 4-hydroxylase
MDVKLELHGLQWRQWILDNLDRGCNLERLVLDMVSSKVWQRQDAYLALEEAIRFRVAITQKGIASPNLPDENFFDLAGRKVAITARSNRPSCALISNLFSKDECDGMIALAIQKGLLERTRSSEVVDASSGIPVDHPARTSTSIFFLQSETPLIRAFEERLSTLTQWPLEKGEGIQILRYTPGQEYKPHFDSFDVSRSGGLSHLSRGGQRLATTLVYLACASAGGSTLFPETGLSVTPEVGGAIFFKNTNELGVQDKFSLHAGRPVEHGEKVVLTYWQREKAFK